MLTEQQRRELDWEKTTDFMPVIVQHAVSGEVLMLGYMNPQALGTDPSKAAKSPSSRALNSNCCGPKAKRRAISST
ncbi:hypothetical protein ACLK15_11855 [Escherichia coli]